LYCAQRDLELESGQSGPLNPRIARRTLRTMNQLPTLAGKQAVLEGLPGHPATKALQASDSPAWDPQAFVDARFDFGELTLSIAPTAIRAACAVVQKAGYNFFEDM